MKIILQINTVVNSGSTGRIAEQIGQLTIQNGWKSYIAYGRNKRPSKSNLIKIGSRLDIGLHVLQTRLFDSHGFSSNKVTRNFIKQIELIKPDIIHLHNLHGYYLNIEILFNYLSILNIPVIWTLHDCWPLTGHCTHFEFIGCYKWETECSNCPQKNEYPKSIFIDRSKKNYHLKKHYFTSVKNMTLIPVSKWLGNIVNKSFLSNYPSQIINNGIDTNIFAPNSSDKIRKKFKLHGKFIILGVNSNWSPRKGLSDFIALSKIIDSNSLIILVGLSSIQLKNLPPNIIGISRTENTLELAKFYSTADVFVNPTWEDNFPTTNLEAMACGTPVITYNTGGSIESVTKDTGMVVEQGNIQELNVTINKIITRGKSSYTQACVDRVKHFYNKDERFHDYISLYDKILSET